MTQQATTQQATTQQVGSPLRQAPRWVKASLVTVAAVAAFLVPLVAVSLLSGDGDGGPTARPVSARVVAEADGPTGLGGAARPTTSSPPLAPLGTVGAELVPDAGRAPSAATQRSSAARDGIGAGDAGAAEAPSAAETGASADSTAPATSEAPEAATTVAASVSTALPPTTATTNATSPATTRPANATTATTASATGASAEVGADCATPGAIASSLDGRQVECRPIGNSGRARWRSV